MKRIKFRGKSAETNDLVRKGEWIYGYLIAPDQITAACVSSGIMVWSVRNSTGRAIKVDPKTVGQFTGFKDKNGVEEFWQGDIIGMFQDTQRSEIFWHNDIGAWMVWAQLSGCSNVGKELLSSVLSTSEKLGNIYETPEALLLLEKQ